MFQLIQGLHVPMPNLAGTLSTSALHVNPSALPDNRPRPSECKKLPSSSSRRPFRSPDLCFHSFRHQHFPTPPFHCLRRVLFCTLVVLSRTDFKKKPLRRSSVSSGAISSNHDSGKARCLRTFHSVREAPASLLGFQYTTPQPTNSCKPRSFRNSGVLCHGNLEKQRH